MSINDLENRFIFHPATNEDTRDRHERVRSICLATAEILTAIVPEGRELSLAITKLEETMFWANAGIARED